MRMTIIIMIQFLALAKKLASYYNIGILLLRWRKLNGRSLSLPDVEVNALSVHANFRKNKLNTGLLRPDSADYLNEAFVQLETVSISV